MAQEIILEMSRYIDKSAQFNQKLIDDLIFKDGFIQFVDREILRTQECLQMETPVDFFSTTDLDEYIRERSLIASFHVTPIYYLFKFCLTLIEERLEKFIDCPEMAVVVLRFIDVLSFQKSAPL